MSYIGELTLEQFRALPLDARIRLAVTEVLGWRYGTGGATRFPREAGSLPRSLVDEHGGKIDCSSLTSFLLMMVYPEAPWNSDHYADLQIFDANAPWSPIRAVLNAGVGSPVPKPVPGCWHLTQTWKSLEPLRGGHARLSYAVNDDVLLVLESTNADNNVGPRWSATTWSALAAYGGGAKVAVLGEG